MRRLTADYYVAKVRAMSSRLIDEVSQSLFWTLTKTDLEVSIVSELSSHPSFSKVDGPWTAFGIVGSLDFSLTGILSRCSSLLADEGISIFAISTYDTDYFLVRKETSEAAIDAWTAGGLSSY